MAHILNGEKEIKKEEKRKLPTITIAIVAHGTDHPYDPSYKFDKIDPNVRIYSRAGMSVCYSIANATTLKRLYEIYLSPDRLSSEDNRTSYEMLQKVSEYYKTPTEDEIFIKAIDNNGDYSQKAVYTLETIANKKHSQIFTPSFDHEYDFEDKRFENGIAVLETKNHKSISNITYQEFPNLAERRYNIDEKSLEKRSNLDQNSIYKFLRNFKIKLNQTLKQYSKDIYENRHLIFEGGFFSIDKLFEELSNTHSKIYDYITSSEDKDIIEKTINDLTIYELDDHEMRLQKDEKLRIFYKDYEKMSSILLRELIDFLKSEGFEVINIIDMSCRSVHEELTKGEIRQLEEDQLKNAMLIDRGLGVTRRKRRRKRTKKRRKQTKKRRR